MHQSAQEYLRPFFEKFEGPTKHLYIDNVGWVTTGIGNKVDPVSDALALDWVNPDGSKASQAQIEDAWATVDAQRTAPKGQHQEGLAMGGGDTGAMRALTSIRLSASGLDSLFARAARGFEAILKNRFPMFDSWPADAQLGIMSLAWANGANFKFPKLQAALLESPPNFTTAAVESGWQNENPGRKAATTLLFTNAAAVQRLGADPTRLYYPSADIAVGAGAVAATGLGAAVFVGAAYAAWRFFTRT